MVRLPVALVPEHPKALFSVVRSSATCWRERAERLEIGW